MFKPGDKIMVYEMGRLWPGCPIEYNWFYIEKTRGTKLVLTWMDAGIEFPCTASALNQERFGAGTGFGAQPREPLERNIDTNLAKKDGIEIRWIRRMK